MGVPSGFIWQPYTDARDVVANSDSFQSWVGVATAEEAKAFIHLFETKKNLTTNEKFAVVMPPDQEGMVLTKETTAGSAGLASFNWEHAVTFGFLQEFSEYTEDNAIAFLNSVGLFMDEILEDDLFALAKSVTQTAFEKVSFKWWDGELRGYQTYWTVHSGV